MNEHARAVEMLTWRVNGRLGGPEADWLEAHLEGCSECRRELAAQQAIRDAIAREPTVEFAPQASFNRLWARIEQDGREALPPATAATGVVTRGRRRGWAAGRTPPGGGAGGPPPPPRPASLPGGARLDTSRFILVAVPNDVAPMRLRMGGTSFEYGDPQAYAVSDGARRAMRSIATRYHLQFAQAWPIDLLHLHCAIFALPAGTVREEVLAQLQKDRRVALAEALHDYDVLTAPDSYAAVQNSNERMAVDQAHLISRGHGVRIALIDTGLASDHPELRGRIEAQRNFVDDDARRFQLDRHGTAVAGVIAADARNGQGISRNAPEYPPLALQGRSPLAGGADSAPLT